MPHLNRPHGLKYTQKCKQPTTKKKIDIVTTYSWEKLSRAWRTLHPYCEACLERNVFTFCAPGNKTGVTDHIIARSVGGAEWDNRNFMTLCNEHHNIKRGLEARGVPLIATKETVNGLLPEDRRLIIPLITIK